MRSESPDPEEEVVQSISQTLNLESCIPSPNIRRAPNRGGGSSEEEQTYIIPKTLNPESTPALTLTLNPEP